MRCNDPQDLIAALNLPVLGNRKPHPSDAAHSAARACLDPRAVAAALDAATAALAGVDAAVAEIWALDLVERVAAWAAGPAGALGFLRACLDLDGLPG